MMSRIHIVIYVYSVIENRSQFINVYYKHIYIFVNKNHILYL